MRATKKVYRSFLVYGALGAVGFLFLFPGIYGVLVSFKLNREIFIWPPAILPRLWSLEGYVEILSQPKYIRYFFNAFLISTFTSFVCVILGSLGGYGISRFRIPAKGILMLGIIALMMFPGPILMIPYVRLSKALHLYDTYLVLVMVNSGFSLPIAIWLLKTFFDSIPPAIEEAALIDGCTRLKALIYVIGPLARAGVIAIFAFAFLRTWNEFMFAMILTKGPERAPISVGLASFFTSYNVHWNAIMATTGLSIIPLMIIFIFLQRYIISGITGGAVK